MNFKAFGILISGLLFSCGTGVAQDTLRITDAEGEALPFANVSLSPEGINVGPTNENGTVVLKDIFLPEQLF